jgi:TolA-binding protein
MNGLFAKPKIPYVILAIGLFTGVARAGLVGHWKFNESSGAVAHDSSVHENIGVFKGDPQWVAGRFGGALEFDGAGDWLDCGTHPGFEITDAVSVTAWIKVRDRGIDHKIASNQDEANGGYKLAVFTNNKVEFEIRTSDEVEVLNRGVAGGTEIEVGVWYHVAGVYSLEDGYIRTYVNGVLDRKLLTTQVLGASPGSLKVGCEPFSPDMYNFNGVIDDLRIYSHVIDEHGIKYLRDHGEDPLAATGYVADMVKDVENAIKELRPEDAVAFIEKEISDYNRWKLKYSGRTKSCDKELPSDINALLARAKQSAGSPVQDIVAAYKQSVLHPRKPSNYVFQSLLWLFENTSKDEYIDAVKEFVHNSDDPFHNICHAARHFESNGNWSPFKLFLDAMFSEGGNSVYYARVVANGLEDNGVWANKFSEYCLSKPEATGYIFHEDERVAGRYLLQKNFGKAAEIYRDIIGRCGPNQEKAVYELKLNECLYYNGQYDRVVQHLERFIKNNKSTHKLLVIKAIMLKGKAHVQLGQIDGATEVFLTLLIEYPEARQAPEASFFIGYGYMLKSEFDKATEAFNLVVKDYPESDYAERARSYLTRIKNMTE